MSFSSRVKEELLEHIGSSRHCRLAELAAIITMVGLDEETPATTKAKRIISMLGIDVEAEEGQKALKLKNCENEIIADRILIERSCCKQAYLRGAFLASGSMTDPEKGYHFEIVCNSVAHAELVSYIMSEFNLDPGIVRRKKYQVVYIKDGSMIVDVLNVMGAHKSLMGMENVRILKDMRNSVNRRVNCETANLNKTVNAAVKQIDDIRYIEQCKGLGYLPDNLRKIAELRLLEPDMPLKELGEKLIPPIGKSGVNHRLRKISEIANELRRS